MENIYMHSSTYIRITDYGIQNTDKMSNFNVSNEWMNTKMEIGDLCNDNFKINSDLSEGTRKS